MSCKTEELYTARSAAMVMGNHGMEATFVFASKTLVDLLLKMNTHNRNIKTNNVGFLAKEMLAERWVPTNQGVGVSRDGVIIDGGHRLEAMRLAGYPPVVFLLVTGLPMAAQKFVDQHAKRSMADTLKLFLNKDVSTRLVAAMNVIHKTIVGWSGSAQKMGPDDTAAMIEKYSDSINAILGLGRAKTLSSPITAALIKRHHETKNDKIIELAADILAGEMLKKGSPALTFRNWMLADRSRSGGANVQRERYEKTLSAIKAQLEGRSIQKLYGVRE